MASLREKHGWNELEEKKRNPILMFLAFFWGPMPCMIWAAIIIELAQAINQVATTGTSNEWVDFVVLCVLQLANALVGFVEEYNAGNAIDALKKNLALNANVIRDGAHKKIPARALVPGDLVEIKLGDVIPADGVLLEGKPVQVDQAALTGESLPVTLGPGSHVKMSSALKMGHTRFIVVATGKDTFIGKAAGLMNSVTHETNLQKILFSITMTLLVMCILACFAIFLRLYFSPSPAGSLIAGSGTNKGLQSLSIVVVILVASIPVAIEVVVTSTMAVGSHVMAAKKVIVARLSAIEELAGMTVLCSDKTGTLTLNKLSLRDPILLDASDAGELMFYAALASMRHGDLDAIDTCISAAVPEPYKSRLADYHEEDFTPFDPVAKRTEALVRAPDGTFFQVSKGAPQIILRLCHNKDEIKATVTASVDELAARGFRSLGVAVSKVDPRSGNPPLWEYSGVLSLFDPPRPDSKDTIADAVRNGVMVKMITGDHGKIAKETCRELGMGTNILNADILDDKTVSQAVLDRTIMESNGFAEVMPEHKFEIVDRIRKMGNLVGMTGDGVNDAPALKRADVGIAVHGATDAARAAAAIVLTEEGIRVTIDAMFESRKIFQRMRNYIIYRIACTMQLLFFFFFGILCIDADGPYFYQGIYYPNATQGGLGNYVGPDYAGGVNATVNTYTGSYPGNGVPLNCWTNSPLPPPPGCYVPPWGGADFVDGAYWWSQHSPSFSLPVISLVIITILNDGCMITISGDIVVPENRPQKWEMWKVWLIASVLGGVALVSSLVLLFLAMHANWLVPSTFFGRILGSSTRDFILWPELRTIMYLKISISDFLTLFSARTRTWFWERCLSRPLAIAFVVATGASTILSLVWGSIFPSGDNHMASLSDSGGAVVFVWIYVRALSLDARMRGGCWGDFCQLGVHWCTLRDPDSRPQRPSFFLLLCLLSLVQCILWWFVQDACKVLAYHVMDEYLDTPASAQARSTGPAPESPDSPVISVKSGADPLEGWLPAAAAKHSSARRVSDAFGRLLGVSGKRMATSAGDGRGRSTSKATVVANPVVSATASSRPSAKAMAAAAAAAGGVQRLPTTHHS